MANHNVPFGVCVQSAEIRRLNYESEVANARARNGYPDQDIQSAYYLISNYIERMYKKLHNRVITNYDYPLCRTTRECMQAREVWDKLKEDLKIDTGYSYSWDRDLCYQINHNICIDLLTRAVLGEITYNRGWYTKLIYHYGKWDFSEDK